MLQSLGLMSLRGNVVLPCPLVLLANPKAVGVPVACPCRPITGAAAAAAAAPAAAAVAAVVIVIVVVVSVVVVGLWLLLFGCCCCCGPKGYPASLGCVARAIRGGLDAAAQKTSMF